MHWARIQQGLRADSCRSPPPAAGRTHSVKVLSNHAYDILLQTDNRTDKPTRQD